MCHVELVAHSDVEVCVRRWRDVAITWDYAQRTRRLRAYLGSRYSMEARTPVDQGVLGILTRLAEPFGKPARSGQEMIDLRLTHQQLADAVSASRPTVSKALRELLPVDVISFTGAGDFRRIHLRTTLAREMATC